MNTHSDESYLGLYGNYEAFTSRNLAKVGVYHLRFSYKPTDDEIARYKAKTADYPAGKLKLELEDRLAERSEKMFRVMSAIAEKFPTHQFYKDERDIPYSSDSWMFFFWCNDRKYRGANFRDYSYFTLSFNNRRNYETRQSDLHELIKYLNSEFFDMPELDVAIQLDVEYDNKAIDELSHEFVDKYNGCSCKYNGMDGKLIKAENGVFFVKKRCRTRGYPLSEREIVSICWKIQEDKNGKESLPEAV